MREMERAGILDSLKAEIKLQTNSILTSYQISRYYHNIHQRVSHEYGPIIPARHPRERLTLNRLYTYQMSQQKTIIMN